MTPNASDILPKERGPVPPSATHLKLPAEIGTDYSFKRRVVWFNAIGFLFLHLAGVYGLYRCFFAQRYTMIWMVFMSFLSGEGVTIGAHRLYSHRAFKATFPVRLFLLILHTIAGQNCLYIWVRDHRQHHKYSDTDADPHNANRGFFFSHIGWLMSKKHPAVISKGKTIDMSDLEADRLVMLQKKYYKPLYGVFALALPILTPVYFWDESLFNSLFVSYFARYVIMLNITWLVNSAAHFYGTKPYDKNMKPVESALVSLLSQGEGWHNYHHAFPWDYRAAELGTRYSMTTFLINLLASFGMVYDLRTTPHRLIEHRVLRTGDGSHPIQAEHHEGCENLKYRQEDDDKPDDEKCKDEESIKKVGEDNEKRRGEEDKGDGEEYKDIDSINKVVEDNEKRGGEENKVIIKSGRGQISEKNEENDSNQINLGKNELYDEVKNSPGFKSECHEKNCDNEIISDVGAKEMYFDVIEENSDRVLGDVNINEKSFETVNIVKTEEGRIKEKETLLTNRSGIKRHIAVQG